MAYFFLNHSLLHLLRKDSSLNPELTESVVQLANLSCLHIEVLALQAGHLAHMAFNGFWGLESSSSHIYTTSALPSEPSP